MCDTFWNESKKCGLRQIKIPVICSQIFTLNHRSRAAQNRSSPIEARPFIDRLTEVWNFAGTDCFDAVLLLDEKG
jgi:hypothetical protein